MPLTRHVMHKAVQPLTIHFRTFLKPQYLFPTVTARLVSIALKPFPPSSQVYLHFQTDFHALLLRSRFECF